MREIKCRGKRLSNQAWVYGAYYEHQPPPVCLVPEDYVPEKPEHYIIQSGFADWNMSRPIDCIKVDVSTVGQFTGLHDKNGKEIYEGDVIQYKNIEEAGIGIIIYNRFCFMIDFVGEMSPSFLYHFACEEELEVIGNIHDNPELEDLKDERN